MQLWSMEEKYALIKEKLKKYNQEQLLLEYEKLNNDEKKELEDEILQINFDQIQKLYKKAIIKEKNINQKVEPIIGIDKEKMSKEDKEKYRKIGEQIIKSGEYAVITMAGGQRNKTWT